MFVCWNFCLYWALFLCYHNRSLLTFRMSIIHHYRIRIHNNCNSVLHYFSSCSNWPYHTSIVFESTYNTYTFKLMRSLWYDGAPRWRRCQISNRLHATSRHITRLNVEFADLIATCNNHVNMIQNTLEPSRQILYTISLWQEAHAYCYRTRVVHIFDFSSRNHWTELYKTLLWDFTRRSTKCVFGSIGEPRWPPDIWLAEQCSTFPLQPLNDIWWKLTRSKY